MEHMRCFVLLLIGSLMLSACGADRKQAIATQSLVTTRISTTSTTATEQVSSTEIAQQGVPLAVYYWPTSLPSAMEIDPAVSRVDEYGYFLKTTSAQGQTVFVVAGTAIEDENVLVPSDVESEAIQVRGFQGRILSNGNGYNIFWEDSGVLYGVLATGMASHEILAVAEGLEAVDLTIMRQRLDDKG